MKWEERVKKLLRSMHSFLIFFAVVAFVITCCMVLFVTVLSRTMGITFTDENLGAAAKLTFANVLLLSLIYTVIDGVRRRYMVYLPAKRITEAAKRFMQGDFSVRIQPIRSLNAEDKFNEIIACFNRMAEELAGMETLRTDFIANVSHELKTPLTVMGNYGKLLQQPGLTEEKRLEYAQSIADASRRLADLVSNILKLSKLENQKLLPSLQVYDLGEQLCESLLDFESAWERKGLQIETQLEDDVLIRSDPEILRLVWSNLFSNAVKFTKPGGKISVQLETQGGYVLVRVKDTGCGISREVGARMFDKFYQGDTSHATQGNGLGLALVKRIIDITGSDISVESEVGKGSTFTVRLRRAENGKIQNDPA